MIIKLFGLGIKDYFKDGFNIFDCLLVIASTIDIGITYANLASASAAL